MKFTFDGYNWLVRLQRGERLVENLTTLVQNEKIGGAWISGLGAAEWAELGFYDLKKNAYEWKKFDQLMEITSLQGNVSWQDGAPIIHLHGTLSDDSMRAYGGHVKELQAGGTIELMVHHWYKDKLTRFLDPETGLKLLEV